MVLMTLIPYRSSLWERANRVPWTGAAASQLDTYSHAAQAPDTDLAPDTERDVYSAGQKGVKSGWAHKGGLHPGHILAPGLLFPFLLPRPCLHLHLVQQFILQQRSQ